jgi:capsular polysaccharide biosynthesis protein
MNLRMIFGLCGLLIGLALCVRGLEILLSPAEYQAVVQIEIEPYSVPDENGDTYFSDPYFIETDLKVMEGGMVLSNVVQTLNLDVEWGKRYANGRELETSEAIDLLRRRMVINADRNTKLIEIGVLDGDPNEAARIANTIVEAYREYRIAQHQQQLAGGIKALENEYQKEAM